MSLSRAMQVAGHVDAVDLNCGELSLARSLALSFSLCFDAPYSRPTRPQVARNGGQEGVGAALLKKPELVRDMVRQAKERAGIPISIKIRIAPDLRETVEIVKLAEQVRSRVVLLNLEGECTSLGRAEVAFIVNFDADREVRGSDLWN
eukprot:3938367-Rhodomonas_salina.2